MPVVVAFVTPIGTFDSLIWKKSNDRALIQHFTAHTTSSGRKGYATFQDFVWCDTNRCNVLLAPSQAYVTLYTSLALILS